MFLGTFDKDPKSNGDGDRCAWPEITLFHHLTHYFPPASLAHTCDNTYRRDINIERPPHNEPAMAQPFILRLIGPIPHAIGPSPTRIHTYSATGFLPTVRPQASDANINTSLYFIKHNRKLRHDVRPKIPSMQAKRGHCGATLHAWCCKRVVWIVRTTASAVQW